MKNEPFQKNKRDVKTESVRAELVIVGGGLAGTCCAITAARAGITVVLVQDRPVLGGNASSEVRLWTLGATSHMGNNNRWAREGGVIDEILVENLFRNRAGNPLIFDTILLEKVTSESNIRLLLNSSVYDLDKEGPDRIKSILAFCSQNSTLYEISAPLFCDASGDGIVGFLAGAAFRMGAESGDEFGEGLAPDPQYGELLGHSLYFYSKDTGKPVKYVPPSFALRDFDKIPKIRSVKTSDQGCNFWWVEYGGRLDTIHQSEEIKWELWKIVYGIWDYIKNSGNYPEAETYALEWVGTIPGKRESRRFEGDYMLSQSDLVEQKQHEDAVAFGGWAMDLHPADGVYSDKPSCNQFHTKGIYQIPLKCYYSKNIRNLFLAGRIISASHVAFGSTRVMATCAQGGQAVGMAAAICQQRGLLPAGLIHPPGLKFLQDQLNLAGQSIPLIPIRDESNLVASAVVEASSTLQLSALPSDGPWLKLANPACQMIPVITGTLPEFRFYADARKNSELEIELRISSRPWNYTPDVILEVHHRKLKKGKQEVQLSFSENFIEQRYAFICFRKNKEVSLRCSKTRITGILSVFNKTNFRVSNFGKQEAPEGSGIESFEFWTPERRPAGHNMAMSLSAPLDIASAENIRNGFTRPGTGTNAWIADPGDPEPTLRLRWAEPVTVKRIVIFFDPDYDHPMESVLMGHPEEQGPFVVRNYRIEDGNGRILYHREGNHKGRDEIRFSRVERLDEMAFRIEHPSKNCPAAVFELLCFPD